MNRLAPTTVTTVLASLAPLTVLPGSSALSDHVDRSAFHEAAPDSYACALEVRRVSGPTTVRPGDVVEASVAITLTVTTDGSSGRPTIDRDLLELEWTAGPAELGAVRPEAGGVTLVESARSAGSPSSHSWEGHFTVEYEAGLRAGIERLPIVVVNREHGPWGAGDYPAPCTAWTGVLPFVIQATSDHAGEFLLHIFGTYQGEGSGGAASWTGSFSVNDDGALDGGGVRVQADRGSCFQALVQESFDIGGFIEDGRFHFRILNYQRQRDDLEMAQRLDCLVNAFKEAGTLLLDVAKRLDFQEVTLPVPDSGAEEQIHQGFTYRVHRLR